LWIESDREKISENDKTPLASVSENVNGSVCTVGSVAAGVGSFEAVGFSPLSDSECDNLDESSCSNSILRKSKTH
jgi:hypothetical protein